MFDSYSSDQASELEPIGFDYDQVENMDREEERQERADEHREALQEDGENV